jgi:hypothetical protein
MPQRILAFFALALGLAAPALGRIGETEAQLISRFGRPITRGPHVVSEAGKQVELCPSLTFELREWIITCVLIDGVCARICYLRSGSWNERFFEMILDANRHGGRWTDLLPVKLRPLMRKWRRDDGIMAEWVAGSLAITAPVYEKTKLIAREKALSAADVARR